MLRILFLLVAILFHEGNCLKCLTCEHTSDRANLPCVQATGIDSVPCDNGECFTLRTASVYNHSTTFERGCLVDGHGSAYLKRCLGDSSCVETVVTCQDEKCNYNKECHPTTEPCSESGPVYSKNRWTRATHIACPSNQYCGKCAKKDREDSNVKSCCYSCSCYSSCKDKCGFENGKLCTRSRSWINTVDTSMMMMMIAMVVIGTSRQ